MSMKKIALPSLLAVVFSLFLVFGLPMLASAQSTGPYLGLEYGKATGLGSEDVRFTVAQIIIVALGLLGTICTVIILYAGFRWMTSAGNEDAIGSAKKTLIAAVIGLLIIFAAYAITRFVMTQLYKATVGDEYYNFDNF